MSKQQKKGSREAARPENKVSFDEVVALIKERRKYADWIAALEAKKEQTPAGVYAKVHLDYETRLAAVVDKLAVHKGTLSAEQETLRGKLAELESEIEARQEERAETELRAHVGELSAAALTEALRVADTEIEQLESRRDSIEADLAKITEFFSAAEGGGTIPSTTPRPRSGGFDELSFLNSVVGAAKPAAAEEPKLESPPRRPTPPPVAAAKSEPPAPKVEPPAPKVEPPAPKVEPPTPPSDAPPLKPVEVPPSAPPSPPSQPDAPRVADAKPALAEMPQADGAVEKATELDAKPAPRPIPRQSIAMQMAALTIEPGAGSKAQSDLGIIKTGDELPPSILSDLTPGEGGQKPLAANIASNDPFTLHASSGGNVKNLKCKECGALNLSTEWYCERCGAELSVI